MNNQDAHKREAIRTCYLLQGASEESIRRFTARSSIETCKARQSLFSTGDETDGLRIVISGLVRIWVNDAEGREYTVTLAEKGDPIGEIATLDGQTRSANATVMDPAKLLWLRQSAFDEILADDPALTRHLIHLLCDRLRTTTANLSGFAFYTLHRRLAGKLHELAMAHADLGEGRARFGRRFSQTELAQMLGATREAVNKRLAAMTDDGLLSVTDGMIHIHDVDALDAIAQERY